MAQQNVYDVALAEVTAGKKKSHWMWYIFPQLRELGVSQRAIYYGISDIDEAKEYLNHPILNKRLVEICEALLLNTDKSAVKIFGDIDAIKLRSSMTLFAVVGGEPSVFHKVLDRFYGGEFDPQTIALLKK